MRNDFNPLMFHFPNFTVMMGAGLKNCINVLEYQIHYAALHLFDEVGQDSDFYVTV
jgi:hypothetical protein